MACGLTALRRGTEKAKEEKTMSLPVWIHALLMCLPENRPMSNRCPGVHAMMLRLPRNPIYSYSIARKETCMLSLKLPYLSRNADVLLVFATTF
jgi:hypothetical protein